MERAIRMMVGSDRDKEQFAPFMYMPGATFMSLGSRPVYIDGEWSFQDQSDLYLVKAGVEQFKTNCYKLEGWSVDKGWPTPTPEDTTYSSFSCVSKCATGHLKRLRTTRYMATEIACVPLLPLAEL